MQHYDTKYTWRFTYPKDSTLKTDNNTYIRDFRMRNDFITSIRNIDQSTRVVDIDDHQFPIKDVLHALEHLEKMETESLEHTYTQVAKIQDTPPQEQKWIFMYPKNYELHQTLYPTFKPFTCEKRSRAQFLEDIIFDSDKKTHYVICDNGRVVSSKFKDELLQCLRRK